MTETQGLAAFRESVVVSRETCTRLEAYATLLKKWNRTINLVAPSTLPDLWNRHFLESAEVLKACPVTEGAWLDLGSGAGFPGLVAAVIARDESPGLSFTLVEADLRKATFLRTVSRETSTPVHILSRRIEDTPPQSATVVTARALAPLQKLLGLAHRHLTDGGICLFPKGASYRAEIDEALADWQFSVDVLPSATSAESAILRLGDLRRA